MFNVYGQVGRDVVVVGNGVRRAGLTLHYNTVLRGNAVLRVVCLRCVADNARKPNVANAQLADALQSPFVEVVHLSAAIFGNRPPPFVSEVAIAEKPWKHLIYDNLVVHDGVFIPKVERARNAFLVMIILCRVQQQPCRCDLSCLARPYLDRIR